MGFSKHIMKLLTANYTYFSTFTATKVTIETEFYRKQVQVTVIQHSPPGGSFKVETLIKTNFCHRVMPFPWDQLNSRHIPSPIPTPAWLALHPLLSFHAASSSLHTCCFVPTFTFIFNTVSGSHPVTYLQPPGWSFSTYPSLWAFCISRVTSWQSFQLCMKLNPISCQTNGVFIYYC